MVAGGYDTWSDSNWLITHNQGKTLGNLHEGCAWCTEGAQILQSYESTPNVARPGKKREGRLINTRVCINQSGCIDLIQGV